MKKIICILIFLFIISNKNVVKENNIKKIDIINKLDVYKEKYNNEDIIGIIKIEDTKINNLVVKSNNNDYYLNHNLNKEKDILGNIYMDYRVDLDSKQINIYGHSSSYYDLPFNELKKYLNKDFYEKHKIINIFNGYKTSNYLIFSVNIRNDKEHMIVNSVNYNKHIKELSKSLYNTNVKVNEEEDILILQTCYDNSYLIISAKKVYSTV